MGRNQVEATVANRDGGFILCHVPPNDHYNHYLHNGYVAFLQYGACGASLYETLSKNSTAHFRLHLLASFVSSL